MNSNIPNSQKPYSFSKNYYKKKSKLSLSVGFVILAVVIIAVTVHVYHKNSRSLIDNNSKDFIQSDTSVNSSDYSSNIETNDSIIYESDESELTVSANDTPIISEIESQIVAGASQFNPDDKNEYWIQFKEGYRNGRLEMSTFSADSNFKVVWNKNLKCNGQIGKCNQYYYTDNDQWEKIGTYGILTDYALEIISSNVDVYDIDGNIVFTKTE